MAFDHRDGAAENPYADLMGRTFVDFDETSGPLRVLDEERVPTLTAWVGRIIPGDGTAWPSAAELDTISYIDAILVKAPELRPTILAGIDAADRAARAEHAGTAFRHLDAAAQVAILKEVEATLAPAAFSVLLELTYEAYYRAPSVQQIVKERTGFDMRNTVEGKPMKPFPVDLLTPVAERPDYYRSVSA